MAREVERKFIVSHIPASVTHTLRPQQIRQGYITKDPSGQQVCIRSKGNYYYLTVKGKGTLKRDEVEIALSSEQFEDLWSIMQGRRIQKKHYEIPYQGHIIELDVFEGTLAGLIFAEIEFYSAEQSLDLEVPEWFDQEVTYDLRYADSQLTNSSKIPPIS